MPVSAPDRPQVTLDRLAGIVVTVPDPDATVAFLGEGLGFATEQREDGWAVICAGDYGPGGQEAIRLVPGERTGLNAVIFDVAGADRLAALRAGLDSLSVAVTDERDGGIRFSDPAGNPLVCALARAVEMPEHRALRPRRLGHVNLKTPDPPATARFYQEALGLRLSEQIGDNLYFLRISSEHHNVGLRPGSHGDLHHCGFELSGWHEYQPLLDHLSEMGITVEYGPGRHRPGNNLFTYLCDPSSGLRIELFADMAHVTGDAYVAPRWEAGDRMTKTVNRWGPLPPESFLA